MISFEAKGDFRKLNSFLERIKEIPKIGELDKYGRMGVEALKNATPRDTGLAASSWYYEIERKNGSTTITWSNSDIEGGCNVIILLQYGHGVKGGGFVQGRDFINPAIRPIFDQIAEDAWKEVKSL